MITDETLPITQTPLSALSTLFVIGEESVLFSKQSGRLYGLDRNATKIANRLGKGERPEEIVRKIGPTAGQAFAVNAIAELIKGKEQPVEDYCTDLPCPRKPSGLQKAAASRRLLDTRFTVEGPPDLLEEWIWPYLALPKEDREDCSDLCITIEPDENDWLLLFNSMQQGKRMPPQRLLPVLYDRLKKFAYQQSSYLLAIHATSLAKGDRTLILTGASGSGKSTLAAALLARGFELLSDEPAVIDSGGNVFSLPLGLALKEGSWAAAGHDYPRFDDLPVHVRFDGQKIRYLHHDMIPLASGARPATHLIFPKYGTQLPGKVSGLSPIEALMAINDAGYQVPGLDEGRTAAILSRLCVMKRFALAYSSTREALDLIEGLSID